MAQPETPQEAKAIRKAKEIAKNMKEEEFSKEEISSLQSQKDLLAYQLRTQAGLTRSNLDHLRKKIEKSKDTLKDTLNAEEKKYADQVIETIEEVQKEKKAPFGDDKKTTEQLAKEKTEENFLDTVQDFVANPAIASLIEKFINIGHSFKGKMMRFLGFESGDETVGMVTE